MASRNRYWNAFLVRFVTALTLLLQRIGGTIPRPLLHALAVPFAALYFLNRKYRRAVTGNMRVLLGPSTTQRQARRMTFKMFVNYARTFADMFHFIGKPTHVIQRLFSLKTGEQHLFQARAAGRGAVLLTAHLGNWEMGGLLLGGMSLPVRIVYVKDRFTGVEQARAAFRNQGDVAGIPVGESPWSVLPVLRALRANELVAMQGDRDFDDTGIELPFCGGIARFPRGPVLTAMMADAPILPVFVIMDAQRRYQVVMEPAVSLQRTRDREADVIENLRRVTAVIERWVLRYPDQWFCFYPFFRLGDDAPGRS